MKKGKFLIEGLEAIDWAIDSEIHLDFILVSNKQSGLGKKYLTRKIYKTSDGLLKKSD